MFQFELKLEAEQPFQQKPYRLTVFKQQLLEKKIREMLDQGIITPSTTNYVSPVLLVPKKNGDYRLVVDFRKLNAITTLETFPLPRIEDCIDFVTQGKYVSLIDLNSAYWQIPVHPDSTKYLGFTTQFGKFEFKKMAFGLKNAAANFQRMIYQLFQDEWLKKVVAYQDDVIVISKTQEQHFEDLELVLNKFCQAGLTVNWTKSTFFCETFQFLGHTISNGTILPQETKVRAIGEFPPLKSVKMVRQFLGLVGFYRRFIPNFSHVAAPLTQLLKKNTKFKFDQQCEDAVIQLKKLMQESPVLCSPVHGHEYIIHTDASDKGVGCVIQQSIDGELRTITFGSRKFQESQRHYSTLDKEAYAIVWTLSAYQYILEGAKIKLFTDNAALSYLFRTTKNNRVLRWAMMVQQFDITVIHKKGKLNKLADCLSRNPVLSDSSELELNAVIQPFNSDVKITTSLIKSHQQLDPDIQKLVAQVQGSAHDKYVVEDGILYRKELCYTSRQRRLGQLVLTRNQHLKFYVPESLVEPLLQYCHETPYLGHLSYKKTLRRLKDVAFWPKMNDRVKKFVSSCAVCQRTKYANYPQACLLGQIKAVRPFQVVAMDLAGPLPKSASGNSYFLVILDVFSKWPEVYPLRNAVSQNIVKALQREFLPRFGIPQTIITDNGTQFVSDEVDNLFTSLNIVHQLTPRYHPQANPSERLIKTFKTQLRALLLESSQNRWDEWIPSVLFAIRTMQNDSTNYSPAELVFGRNLQYPLSTVVQSGTYQAAQTLSEYVDSLLQSYEKVYSKAITNVNLRHEQNKQRCDSQKLDVDYNVGDYVKLRHYILASRRKAVTKSLAPVYLAPCKVVAKHSKLLYDVEFVQDNKIFSNIHVSQIFPFVVR